MAAKTDRQAEAREALETLHAQVAEVRGSDDYLRWLRVASRFHRYSPMNAMWMEAQWYCRQIATEALRAAMVAVCGDPRIPSLDGFSQPAAFSTWADMGRNVRKGEKALSVFAPVVVTDRDKPVNPATGKHPTKVIGYTLKRRTFDVSQTEGDPLPENPAVATLLTGDADPRLWDALVAYAESIGSTVTLTRRRDGANGWYTRHSRAINVCDDLAPAARVKTLAHEIGHAMLHADGTDGAGLSRDRMEVEAESVAYVVGNLLGIDTSDYSIGYVIGWADEGKSPAETMTRTIDRVVKAARKVVEAVEATIAETEPVAA